MKLNVSHGYQAIGWLSQWEGLIMRLTNNSQRKFPVFSERLRYAFGAIRSHPVFHTSSRITCTCHWWQWSLEYLPSFWLDFMVTWKPVTWDILVSHKSSSSSIWFCVSNIYLCGSSVYRGCWLYCRDLLGVETSSWLLRCLLLLKMLTSRSISGGRRCMMSMWWV